MREGMMGRAGWGIGVGGDLEQSPLAKCTSSYNFSFIYSKILPSVSLKKTFEPNCPRNPCFIRIHCMTQNLPNCLHIFKLTQKVTEILPCSLHQLKVKIFSF